MMSNGNIQRQPTEGEEEKQGKINTQGLTNFKT
jgi:hypothetical protein